MARVEKTGEIGEGQLTERKKTIVKRGKIIEKSRRENGVMDIFLEDQEGGYLAFVLRPEFWEKIKPEKLLEPGMDVELTVDEENKLIDLKLISQKPGHTIH